MHAHGAVGRKLGRERDQRRALIKSLATSLIEEESIETTLPKAKEVIPYVERLVTKAKKGGLHNRRQVLAAVNTDEAAHKLFEDIAPAAAKRTSGHLSLEKTRLRRGDNAQLARVSFIDDLEKPVKKEAIKKPAEPKEKK